MNNSPEKLNHQLEPDSVQPSDQTMPGLDDFAEKVQASHDDPKIILDRVCEDLIRRFRYGEPVGAETYLKKIPSINQKEFVLELLDAEICCSFGFVQFDIEKMIRRFPKYEIEIRRMEQLCQWEQRAVSEPVAKPDPILTESPDGLKILAQLEGARRFRAERIPQHRNVVTEVLASNWDPINPGPLQLAFTEISIERELAERLCEYRHPNWSSIFEVGRHASDCFLVSQLENTISLDDWRIGKGTKDVAQILMRILYTAISIHQAQLPVEAIPISSVGIRHDGTLLLQHNELIFASSQTTMIEDRNTESTSRVLIQAFDSIYQYLVRDLAEGTLQKWRAPITSCLDSNQIALSDIEQLADNLQATLAKGGPT